MLIHVPLDMHPLFTAIDDYLDPDPARRIIWSTHDETTLDLNTGVTRLTEHMRAALTYRKAGDQHISFYYGAEGTSRAEPFSSVLLQQRFPSIVHLGVTVHENQDLEYTREGNTAVAVHMNFDPKVTDYVVNSFEVNVTRCEKLGYPVLPQTIEKYSKEGYKQFWIPGADLTKVNNFLQTNLAQDLTTPLQAVLAMHGLYHLAGTSRK